MRVCYKRTFTPIMSKQKVTGLKPVDSTSVKVDLTPEQNERVDNHATTYSVGSKTTRVAMDGIFEELGGNEGWAAGGKASFDPLIKKFLRVLQKKTS